MYVPSHFAADQDAVRDLLSNPGAANLVTSTGARPARHAAAVRL